MAGVSSTTRGRTFQIPTVYLEKRQERVIKDTGGVMQCEGAVFDGDFHR